jgi:hypothetical protein
MDPTHYSGGVKTNTNSQGGRNIMRKLVIVTLVVLVGVSIAAPSVAFAQELLPTPDMAAPLALLTFGSLGLVAGIAGYLRRHRARLGKDA